ncbi:hypothetical protein TNCV_1981871 [Trichonephila clavipes]|nr:hypothetical protein TNCV_1981871 [Trichonephila clavipes]
MAFLGKGLKIDMQVMATEMGVEDALEERKKKEEIELDERKRKEEMELAERKRKEEMELAERKRKERDGIG